MLYDGPAADAPATADPSASMIRRPLVLLAGLHQGREVNREDGSAAFARGVSAYRQGTLGDASRDFEAAAAAEPGNALYLYYRALAQFEQLGADSAADALQQAVEAEKQGPISGWGKQMERVQGRRPRVDRKGPSRSRAGPLNCSTIARGLRRDPPLLGLVGEHRLVAGARLDR